MEFYGLSATAFAEELEFNRSTISHLLSGRNKPSLDFVVKILQRFPEVTMSWLIFSKGNFPSTSENIDELKNANKPGKTKSSDSKDIPEELGMENLIATSQKTSGKKVEKIIMLYSDGSFNVYEN